MTKEEAKKLTAMVFVMWPQAKPEPALLETFSRGLQGLSYEQAKRAIERLYKTSKWLPAMAEICEAALELELGPRRLGGEAWGDVDMAIRRVGRNGLPKFEDPGVAECVRLMGWLNLCNSTNDTADRARFIELYDGLQARARRDMQAGHALPPARGLAALPASQPEHTAVRGLLDGASAQLAPPWEPKVLGPKQAVTAKPELDIEVAQRRAEQEQARQRKIAAEMLEAEARKASGQ